MFINYAGVLVLLGLKHKNFKIYVAGGFIKPGLRYWWSWKTDDNYTLLNKESRVPTDGYAYGDEEDILQNIQNASGIKGIILRL